MVYVDISRSLRVIPPINQERLQQVNTLKKSAASPFTCGITTQVQDIPSTDPYSTSHKRRVSFLYQDHTIVQLTNLMDVEGDTGIEGKFVRCLRNGKDVYALFDTITSSDKINYGLPGDVLFGYVSVSHDGGFTWSGIRSLESAHLSMQVEDFDAGKISLMGDERGFVIKVSNKLDYTEYLLDKDFQVVATSKGSPMYNWSDYYSYFYFFHGTIYTVRMELPNGGNNSFIEASKDYGKSWKKIVSPWIYEGYRFGTYEDSLYLFSDSLCPASSSPSLGKLLLVEGLNSPCRNIFVRKLGSDGQWSDQKLLLAETAYRIFGVYGEKTPILVWGDSRFIKLPWIGYVPVLGALYGWPESPGLWDSSGPRVMYAGEVDLTNFQLKDGLVIFDSVKDWDK